MLQSKRYPLGLPLLIRIDHMNQALPVFLGFCSLSSAQTVLFQDNFNTADTPGFNSAPLAGRLSGTLSSETYFRQTKQVQQISGNQLLTTGTGGLRFENTSNDPDITGNMDHFDWAAGAAGTAILDANGFVVTFDWTPENNNDPQWISWNVGHPNADANFRITGGLTDYGILLRNDGRSERFDNGSNLGAGGNYNASPGGATTYAVRMAFSFSSFADGSNVTAITSVDGTQVASDTFQWDGNNGAMHMEFFTNKTGNFIDDLTISTPTASTYTLTLTGNSFTSSDPQGTDIGTLTGILDGDPEASTFTLVAGEGGEDNAKFQISGSEIQVGNFDFTGAGSTHQEVFNVRVLSTGDAGGQTEEKALSLNVIKDDDADKLVDDWEISFTGGLTNLSGVLGTEDFDNDNLPDLDEFLISNGDLEGIPAYPAINPNDADSDDDQLNDGEEINPSGQRPQTNPTAADTDLDGLSDLVETNTGTFTSSENTGTNPTACDSDGDGARDGFELANGGTPFDANDFSASADSRVTIQRLTDLASSEIDSSKTYTHAVSGGGAATVNGVNFDYLGPVDTPADFLWETGGQNTGQIIANLNTWDPTSGGITSFEIQDLLAGFVFSQNGTQAGSSQSYTLSGLDIGTTYDVRLYIRSWNDAGSGRPIDLTFINGTEEVTPFGALPADRPGSVTETGNINDAYFVSYTYTAQSTEFTVSASVPDCAIGTSGSFHMYALSNEISVPKGPPLITRTLLLPSGNFAIAFTGAPNTEYTVTTSLDLLDEFEPVSNPTVTTDFEGSGQFIIPAVEVSEPKRFFRIEK